MTTAQARKRRQEIGDDNDRATIIFVAAGCIGITVTWAAFLVWWLV